VAEAAAAALMQSDVIERMSAFLLRNTELHQPLTDFHYV
jgi:hypothetical protein